MTRERRVAVTRPPRDERVRRRIKPEEVDRIVDEIRAWNFERTPLQWKAVIDLAEQLFGHRYSRQALEQRVPIKQAFQERQIQGTRRSNRLPRDLALAELRRQDQQRAVEIRRLKELLAQAEERFARWSYNAFKNGVSEDALNEALHPVDRRQTDPKMNRKGKRSPRP